jgi:hypothetical protein
MAIDVLTVLMLNDLKKSALTASHAKKLHFSTTSEEALSKLVGRPTSGGYELPYADFKGKVSGFSRYKLFAPIVFKTSKMRYWQPPKSPPKLYIPTLVNWEKVIADPELEVWLTEGEKKAASLCALGVPCVAVSGVWAWTSKKFQQHLVPELKVLSPRPVVMCFDSDAEENVAVKGALSALAMTLERLGCAVRVCQLPALKGSEKTGLDDFIARHKGNALKKLAELDKEPSGLSVALQALNAELMVVEEQQSPFHLKTRKFVTSRLLVDVVMADRLITTYDRAGNAKQINAAAEWLKWPQRRTVARLTYAPGKSDTLEDGAHNLWKGWGVEPKRGDTRLFDELLQYMAKDLTPEQRAWWLQWLAYPLQHPGAKQYSAVLVYSHHTGTGKTLLGYTLGRIYGDNAVEVAQDQLHSTFNSWARCRQFIIGDEITGSDKRSDADKLKHMITRENLLINEKFQPTYELPDTCNYYLTTNQPDAVYVEKTDRRYFIIEIQGEPMPKSFYTAYDKWYRTDAGAAAVFSKLLDVNLRGFDHQAQPPLTTAKEAMYEATGTEAEAVVRDLLRDPKTALRLVGRSEGCELFTLQQLQAMLDPSGRMGRQQIGRALYKAGAPRAVVTNVGEGSAKALYAIKNFRHWAKAPHISRVEHYKKCNPAAGASPLNGSGEKIKDRVASARRKVSEAKAELRAATANNVH